MRKISKGIIVVQMLLVAFTLTGCMALNDYVSSEVTKSSDADIRESTGYQQYQQFQADGLLADDGLFPLPPENSEDVSAADEQSVQVTIATNSFLNCIYYTNEETKAPIVASEVFLHRGESLYAANVSVNNSISNLYGFSRFRVWSYDQDGRRSNSPYLESTTQTGLIFTVPDGFNGTGFSVEPLGYYTNRHITANAYYLIDGQPSNLPNGRWEVNNDLFNGSADISPVDSYTIVYSYEPYKNDYYFVDSVPKYWYSKESNYTVIFREVSSNEQETAFSVEMHPYITMKVTNSCLSWAAGLPVIGDHGEGIIQSITRNGESIEQEYSGLPEFSIRKLKVNDTISIRVGSGYKITGTNVNVGTAVQLGSNAENGYEYTIIVPDTRSGIEIEITDRNSNAEGTFQGYNLANADIRITRANGVALKIGDELPGDDEKVTLTITPHSGFYIKGFTDKDSYAFVKKSIKFSSLEQEIHKILDDHPAIHFITLELTFTDDSGDFTYKLDGKAVTASPLLNVRVGQTLKVEYKARAGFAITHSWFGANAFYNAYTWAGGTDSISESIEVTPDMDGSTIDRETFGIVVEKVG